DLSKYAGQTVQLGFHLRARDCCGGYDGGPGWYIDDVSVVVGPIVFDPHNSPEGFESGLGDWASDSGTWEVGVPTSGPPPNADGRRAHSGTQVAATVLAGSYAESFDSRLISPPFEISSSWENPRLRFWHWYSFGGGDSGSVQIKAGTNDWETLAIYTSTPGVWHYPLLDLSPYAGQTVRLGFLLSARDCCGGYDGGPGWYIDDISITNGPLTWDPVHNLETFELGWGNWASDSGTWEIGVPTSGPPPNPHDRRAYSGTNVAATVLAGGYAESFDSRLISPPFRVPPAGLNPRLRFWQWYSFGGGDWGSVQIKPGTNDWTTLAIYTLTPGVWHYPLIDLSSYADQEVRLGFLLSARDCCGGYDGGPGWYIDDVGIGVGPIQVHNPEDFELGISEWSSDQGTWEVGPPTSGPGQAHSGVNAAGTVLAGNYAEVISSRLISPAFVVPQVNARCRFWHWYSFGGGDSGTLQIREGTNEWATLDTFSGSSGGWFNNPPIDLTAFAGKAVQLGFLFTAIDCCGGYDGGPGWYVDDVCVLGGSLSFNGVAEKAANEESLLTFQARVSGANASSDLRFDLGTRPPEGAVIDQRTGVFTWTPTEVQGPSTYRIPINAVDLGNGGQNACTIVVINVNEVNKPPSLMVTNHTVEATQPFTLDLCPKDPDIPANALACALLSGPPGMTINSDACRLNWTPTLEQLGSHTVTVMITDQNPDAINDKQLSATNTFTITVATNTIYSLQIRRVTAGDFEFTIAGGQAGNNYVLQSAPFLLYCPPTNYWQDVRTVQPTSARYTFNYTEPQFGVTTNRWYRLRTP
ncbi:MAG TPA: choice-of-anchor J domain-containing protein, partial [Verrucomicrobiae bacterium]|nr:choice-of-anchor J domain-containing protein [Verrucomicrobiae bacterium]